MSTLNLNNSFADFVRDMMNPVLCDWERKASYAIGLTAEASEVLALVTSAWESREKYRLDLIDEMGDVLHYLYGNAILWELNPKAIHSMQFTLSRDIYFCPTNRMQVACGAFADEVKKILFHGKEVNRARLIVLYHEVAAEVAFAAWYYAIDLYQMEQSNIEKIQKRHPGGKFSADYLHRVACQNIKEVPEVKSALGFRLCDCAECDA